MEYGQHPTDLRRRRERAGLSVHDLAAELGVRPAVVEDWEGGRKKVPRSRWGEIAWLLAAAEQDVVLRDLPPCDWVRVWEARSQETMSTAELERHYQALGDHATGCQRCQERETRLKSHGEPLPPYPITAAQRLEFSLIGAVDRLWDDGRGARPLILTAAALLAAAAVRFPPRSTVWAVVLYPIALGAAMASGFGVYGRLSVLRSGGPLSRWLARYIGFAVGVFLFGAVFMIGGHADVFGSSQDVTLSWPLLALLAAIVGLLWATFAGIMR